MLIVNTLFFKGLWRGKYFSPENTRNGKFYLIDNRTVDTSIIHAYGRFYYVESSDLDAKILRIPYDVYNLLFSFFLFFILSYFRDSSLYICYYHA